MKQGALLQDLIQRYEELLAKNPKSQTFAALAEAYRKSGLLEKAFYTAAQGVKKHPHFASGHLVLGRTQWERGNTEQAEFCFENTLKLESKNILALQMLAQLNLKARSLKRALIYFKKILLAHPEDKKTKEVVKKLEQSLLKADKDDDLSLDSLGKKPNLQSYDFLDDSPEPRRLLDRYTSLADTFISKGETEKALRYLAQAKRNLEPHEEIAKRLAAIKLKDSFALSESNFESASDVTKSKNKTSTYKINYLKNLKKQVASRQHKNQDNISVDGLQQKNSK